METKSPLFFRIRHGGSYAKQFAWAAGFDPIPGGMPFLTAKELEWKEASWALSPELKCGLRVEGDGRASQWPDFMGHGAGHPSFFVSAHVIHSLRKADFRFSRITEMPIGNIESHRLRCVSPPAYYVIEADRAIEIDYEASGVEVDRDGRPHWDPLRPPKWKLNSKTWTGAHLFSWPKYGGGGTTNLLCTERIRELAEQDGWSNVKFVPIPAV